MVSPPQRAQPVRGALPAVAMLVLLAVLAGVLLAFPVRLPIGANHWDLYMFVDAAARIAAGQRPHLDFFAPAGPLAFYLPRWTLDLFPQAHPLLAAQYGVLLVTWLPMVLIAADVARRSLRASLLVTAPFAALSLLPFNAISFFPSPGVDAIGLYNRQAGLMLYPLIAALFLGSGPMIKAVVGGLMLAALFYTKINAFLPALVLLAVSPLFGLASWRTMLGGFAVAVLAILLTGLPSGILQAYMADVAALAAHNSGRIAGRLLTLLSVKVEVIVALFGVLCVLAVAERRAIANALVGRGVHSNTGASRITAVLGLRAPRLAMLIVMGLAVEMQNTGSQEFAWLWPALVAMSPAPWGLSQAPQTPRTGAALTLALALVALPTAAILFHAAARAGAGAPTYARLDVPGLEIVGAHSVKPAHLHHAALMQSHYLRSREALAELAAQGELPSSILLSHPEFQAFFLQDLSRAVAALSAWEASSGRRLERIAVLDYVNLASAALRRQPVEGLTVSLDLARGFPASRLPRLQGALASADALLLPRCPVLSFRLEIERMAQPALASREIIPLNPCWDMALKRT